MISSCIKYFILVHSVCVTCDGVTKDDKACKSSSTSKEMIMVQRVAAKVSSTPGKRNQAKLGTVPQVAYGGQQDRLASFFSMAVSKLEAVTGFDIDQDGSIEGKLKSDISGRKQQYTIDNNRTESREAESREAERKEAERKEVERQAMGVTVGNTIKLAGVSEVLSKPNHVLETLSSNVRSLEASLSEVQRQDVNAIKTQKAEYEMTLESQRHNNTLLAQKNKNTSDRIAALNMSNEGLRSRAQKLTKQCASLTADLKVLQANISNAHEFIECSDHSQSHYQVHRTVDEVDKVVFELEECNVALQTELETLQDEVHELRALLEHRQGGIFRRLAVWVCCCCHCSTPEPPLEPKMKKRPIRPARLTSAKSSRKGQSLIAATVELFRDALPDGGSSNAEGLVVLRRKPFVEALDEFAKVLDVISGGQMGSHILTNTKKLRLCDHNESEDSYQKWVVAGIYIPAHEKNGYKHFDDSSAPMANLWLGWMMEFFVEMFALLVKGQETKPSCNSAYDQTLKHHHNYFQQTMFQSAVGRLPSRQKLFSSLQGGASLSDVEKDVDDFVTLARPAVKVCLETSSECSRLMKSEHDKQRRR